MSDYILELNNITKEFPGVKALDNVNLRVKRGEIHGLVGENGAGKSTLMKVLSAVYPAGTFTGDIVYDGEKREFTHIRQSEEAGIVIVHQELELVNELSIAENLFLGNECQHGGVIQKKEMLKRAAELLKLVKLNESPTSLIQDIGVGKQQLVEIAKALSKKVKLLILDEPTAALNDEESKILLNLMLEFKENGITSIIISHKLEEISYVADSITVLRDGKTVDFFEDNVKDLSHDVIIKSMVGREMSDRFPERNVEIGEILYEVKDWNVYHPINGDRKIIDNVSLNVKAGEVIGIAGMMGAGRTEFAMSLFGRSYGSHISGCVEKKGKQIDVRSVKNAIKNGIAYISEDRKNYGLVLINDIKSNTTLAALKKVSRGGIINKNKEIQEANLKKEELKIKTPSVKQLVGNLSGGNQQKVVLAKWIFTEPDLLILDEPTRGIDIGAKYEIYLIINELAKQGKSIIIISSEMAEIIGMCDRIYVMSEGRIKGELTKDEVNQEKIMQYIVS